LSRTPGTSLQIGSRIGRSRRSCRFGLNGRRSRRRSRRRTAIGWRSRCLSRFRCLLWRRGRCCRRRSWGRRGCRCRLFFWLTSATT